MTYKGFNRLILLRREIGEGLFGKNYKYVAFITNLSYEDYTTGFVIRWYNGRGDTENILISKISVPLGLRRQILSL